MSNFGQTSGKTALQQCIHCCKGDTASQWEMAILGMLKTPEPIDLNLTRDYS